jgi:hypothetical protein
MLTLPFGVLLVPFLVQGAAIVFDEFYFHRKRGLPRWERLGHPLDTLSQISVFLFAWAVAPTTTNARLWFIALAVFSSLLVTKDEWVHTKLCSSAEHWLHSLLFILHPTVMGCTYLLWPLLHNGNSSVRTFLAGELLLVVSFFVYQVLYWGFLWNRKRSLA